MQLYNFFFGTIHAKGVTLFTKLFRILHPPSRYASVEPQVALICSFDMNDIYKQAVTIYLVTIIIKLENRCNCPSLQVSF